MGTAKLTEGKVLDLQARIQLMNGEAISVLAAKHTCSLMKIHKAISKWSATCFLMFLLLVAWNMTC